MKDFILKLLILLVLLMSIMLGFYITWVLFTNIYFVVAFPFFVIFL